MPRRRLLDGIVLGYRYESDVIVPDGTMPPSVEDPLRQYAPVARPGHRAPHVWREHDGARRSILDLFGGGFVALTDPTGRDGLAAAVGAVRDSKVPLRCHAIEETVWRDSYGVHPGGIVLVRPDGHVAWRAAATPRDVVGELRSALAVATGA